MKKSTGLMIIRIIISPFLLCIFLITYIIFAVKRFILFIKYGGEWINYEPDEKITIEMIYEQLKQRDK